jgi:hypothetical protein
MPLTVIESDSFPTTLQVPVANEAASAPALVAEFLQGIANSRRWLYNRISILLNGGTLAPAAPIVVNGAGISVGGPLAANGTLVVNGVATLNNTTNLSAANFAGAAAFGAPLTANAAAIFNSSVAAAQGVTPRFLAGPDAAATIDPTVYDTVYVQALSANRVYTLSNAAGLIGRVIKFTIGGLANHVTIVDGIGTTLCQIQGTSGTLGGVEVMFVSNLTGAAKVVSAYTVP